MTTGGGVFMTFSVVSVITLLIWCYARILRRTDD